MTTIDKSFIQGIIDGLVYDSMVNNNRPSMKMFNDGSNYWFKWNDDGSLNAIRCPKRNGMFDGFQLVGKSMNFSVVCI